MWGCSSGEEKGTWVEPDGTGKAGGKVLLSRGRETLRSLEC